MSDKIISKPVETYAKIVRDIHSTDFSVQIEAAELLATVCERAAKFTTLYPDQAGKNGNA